MRGEILGSATRSRLSRSSASCRIPSRARARAFHPLLIMASGGVPAVINATSLEMNSGVPGGAITLTPNPGWRSTNGRTIVDSHSSARAGFQKK